MANWPCPILKIFIHYGLHGPSMGRILGYFSYMFKEMQSVFLTRNNEVQAIHYKR